MQITNALIVDTKVVQENRTPFTYFYEITLAPDAEPGARRTILVTRDEREYETALAAEGLPIRFLATWHQGKRNGRLVQVLDRLEVLS